MSPNEIPGGLDDLEPIHDGADLEPLLDGDDLEPIESETPVDAPEAESSVEVSEEAGLPEIMEPEPVKEEPMAELEPSEEPAQVEEPAPVKDGAEPEVEAESVTRVEPAAGAAGEKAEAPQEERDDAVLGGAALGVAAIAGDAAVGEAEGATQPASDAGERRGEGERQQQGPRELEKAPLIQLKAAQFLMLACFLPWADPSSEWFPAEIEKLVCVFGIWLAVQAQLAHGGEKALGFMKGLVKSGPRNGVLLGLVVSLVGLAPFATEEFATSILLEKLTLIGAGFTYAHIVGYRLGGGFNPLYAFAFTLPLFGGIPGIMNAIGADAPGLAKLLGGLGAVGALWFGIQGVRALVIAMIEAKREGEAKKKANLEARRAARKAGKKVPPRTPRKPRS